MVQPNIEKFAEMFNKPEVSVFNKFYDFDRNNLFLTLCVFLHGKSIKSLQLVDQIEAMKVHIIIVLSISNLWN